MKKSILIIAGIFALTAYLPTQAQKKGSTSLSIGPEVAFPIDNFSVFSKTGYGGTAKFQYNVVDNGGITLTSGYLDFPSKISSTSLGSIPIKVGYRHTLAEFFMVELETGYTAFTNSGSSGAFTLGGGPGITFPAGDAGNIELGTRVEYWFNNGSSNGFIGLRLAYDFKLGKGK